MRIRCTCGNVIEIDLKSKKAKGVVIYIDYDVVNDKISKGVMCTNCGKIIKEEVIKRLYTSSRKKR